MENTMMMNNKESKLFELRGFKYYWFTTYIMDGVEGNEQVECGNEKMI